VTHNGISLTGRPHYYAWRARADRVLVETSLRRAAVSTIHSCCGKGCGR
jgi:hypothetical protein